MMNNNQQGRFGSEVEAGIAGYLRQVRRCMEDSGSAKDEVDGVASDIESQIRGQLSAARGSSATPADLNAIIATMDPPESYSAASKSSCCASTSCCGSPALRLALVGLITALVIFGAYYVIVDARMGSKANKPSPAAPSKTKDIKPAVAPAAPAPSVSEPARATAPESTVVQPTTPVAVPTPTRVNTAVPVAIAGFSATWYGDDKDAVEATVRDGLMNSLAMNPGVRLVERAKLDEGLAELKMGSEGLLDQSTALKLGKIVGARVIITGNIVKIDDKLTITARLINAETSELAATQVVGSRVELQALVDSLSQAVAARIANDPSGVLAKTPDDADLAATRARQAEITQSIAGKALPRILMMIPETHLGQRIPDPAAETELVSWFTECGFAVACPEYEGIHAPRQVAETTQDTDVVFQRNRGWRNEEGNINVSSRFLSQVTTKGLGDERAKLAKIADVLILGEGISERGTDREGLISSKGRLELKVIDIRTGRILLASSTYGAGVDVAERIAGKRALQAAGREMAATLLPDLVRKWNTKPAGQ